MKKVKRFFIDWPVAAFKALLWGLGLGRLL